jgi:hypothetical protein
MWNLFQLPGYIINYLLGRRDAVSADGEASPTPERYHRVFLCLCLLGGVLGLTIAILSLFKPQPGEKASAVGGIDMLLGFPLSGTVFGGAVALMIAPRSFHECPLGRRWLKWFGARPGWEARFGSLIVATFFGGLFAFLLLMALAG